MSSVVVAAAVLAISSVAQADTVVRVWHAYRADEEKALQILARRYEDQHRGVTIDLVALPYDAYAYKLESAIPLGNGPDLFIAAHETLGERAKAGLVTPIADATPEELAAFLPNIVEPLRYEGLLYGLPLSAKSLALFYRTDLLPEAPATTDELFSVNQKGVYPLAYETASAFYHAAWLHAYGGRLLDDKSRPSLGTPESVRALEAVFALQKSGLVPEDATSTLAARLFNDGKAAAVMNGPWFAGEIDPGVPYRVAPLPRVSATGKPLAPLLTIEGVFLAARARAPKEALGFARALASVDGAIVRARAGRQVVATKAAWDDPGVQQNRDLLAFRAQMDATVPMPNGRELSLSWEPIQRALRRALRGAATPERALADADTEILARLRPTPPKARPLPFALVLSAFALAGAVLLMVRAHKNHGSVGGALGRTVGEARRARGAYAALAPAALAMALLVFVPFAVGAAMSLYHHQDGRWTFVGWGNFLDILLCRDAEVWSPLSFWYTLVVTVAWTAINVAGHVTIGVALALLLRDPYLRARGLYRVLLIVPWAVPSYITALTWKGMFHRQFGAINGILVWLGAEPVSWFAKFSTAFAANVATNVWLGFPFMMVVTLGALSRIPKELEEAAALDGATGWQRLRHVVLPLVLPALLPAIVLGAVWTFNMFNVIFLVSGGEPDGATEILVSQAYRWAFTRGHQYGYAAAYAVLIFLLLALQSALARRREEL
jgi:arabinogalactan oligomer/maltooligosaccharide transport system permease protein